MKRVFLLLVLFLVGCGDKDVSPSVTSLLTAIHPWRINVAKIDVVHKYISPNSAPNVEHVFKIPLPQAIEKWAKGRLIAAGAEGTAKVTIEDASVIESSVAESDSFIQSTFSRPKIQYDALAIVAIEIFDKSENLKFSTRARTSISNIVDKQISEEDKKNLWIEITNTVIERLDKELEKGLSSQIRKW